MNDSNVDAPIRSPAAAKTVFGVLGAELLDRAGEHGRAGLDAVGRQDPTVEVVGAEEVDLDRGRPRGPVERRAQATRPPWPRRRRRRRHERPIDSE